MTRLLATRCTNKLGVCFYAVAECRVGHKLLVNPPDEPLQLASDSSGELHDSSAARHIAQVRCCVTFGRPTELVANMSNTPGCKLSCSPAEPTERLVQRCKQVLVDQDCFCFCAPVNAGDIQLLLDDAAKLGIQHSKCITLSIFLQKLFETWIAEMVSDFSFAEMLHHAIICMQKCCIMLLSAYRNPCSTRDMVVCAQYLC